MDDAARRRAHEGALIRDDFVIAQQDFVIAIPSMSAPWMQASPSSRAALAAMPALKRTGLCSGTLAHRDDALGQNSPRRSTKFLSKSSKRKSVADDATQRVAAEVLAGAQLPARAWSFVAFGRQRARTTGVKCPFGGNFELIGLATLHESIGVETLAQLNESSRKIQALGGSTESAGWRTVLRNEGRARAN